MFLRARQAAATLAGLRGRTRTTSTRSFIDPHPVPPHVGGGEGLRHGGIIISGRDAHSADPPAGLPDRFGPDRDRLAGPDGPAPPALLPSSVHAEPGRRPRPL